MPTAAKTVNTAALSAADAAGRAAAANDPACGAAWQPVPEDANPSGPIPRHATRASTYQRSVPQVSTALVLSPSAERRTVKVGVVMLPGN